MITLGRTVRQCLADVEFIPTYLRSGPQLTFTKQAAGCPAFFVPLGYTSSSRRRSARRKEIED